MRLALVFAGKKYGLAVIDNNYTDRAGQPATVYSCYYKRKVIANSATEGIAAVNGVAYLLKRLASGSF